MDIEYAKANLTKEHIREALCKTFLEEIQTLNDRIAWIKERNENDPWIKKCENKIKELKIQLEAQKLRSRYLQKHREIIMAERREEAEKINQLYNEIHSLVALRNKTARLLDLDPPGSDETYLRVVDRRVKDLKSERDEAYKKGQDDVVTRIVKLLEDMRKLSNNSDYEIPSRDLYGEGKEEGLTEAIDRIVKEEWGEKLSDTLVEVDECQDCAESMNGGGVLCQRHLGQAE